MKGQFQCHSSGVGAGFGRAVRLGVATGALLLVGACAVERDRLADLMCGPEVKRSELLLSNPLPVSDPAER